MRKNIVIVINIQDSISPLSLNNPIPRRSATRTSFKCLDQTSTTSRHCAVTQLNNTVSFDFLKIISYYFASFIFDLTIYAQCTWTFPSEIINLTIYFFCSNLESRRLFVRGISKSLCCRAVHRIWVCWTYQLRSSSTRRLSIPCLFISFQNLDE